MKRGVLVIYFLVLVLFFHTFVFGENIVSKSGVSTEESITSKLTGLGMELLKYLISQQNKIVVAEDQALFDILYADMLVLEANDRGFLSVWVIEAMHQEENQFSRATNSLAIKYSENIKEKIEERLASYAALKKKNNNELLIQSIESNRRYYDKMYKILSEAEEKLSNILPVSR